jgi:hypothetical protein
MEIFHDSVQAVCCGCITDLNCETRPRRSGDGTAPAAAIGLAIGTALGVMNLVDTARRPLAPDDGGMMLAWVIAVLFVWTVAACTVTWTTRRFVIATIVVFHAASIIRVNLFLDVIRYRDDWRNLMSRYNDSQ